MDLDTERVDATKPADDDPLRVSGRFGRLTDSVSCEDGARNEHDVTVCMRSTSYAGRAVEHAHKLEKKQSSGDLHSRLKTRKLLGVGETPDGDVHRSKLSQILGHSDQLYMKLPRGVRLWQYANAIVVTLLAAVAILFPAYYTGQLPEQTTSADAGDESGFIRETGTAGRSTPAAESHETARDEGAQKILVVVRLQGAALGGLAVLLWSSLRVTDRDAIRCTALASTIFWSLHVAVLSLGLIDAGQFVDAAWRILPQRVLAIAASVYYTRALGRHPARSKTTSHGFASLTTGGAGVLSTPPPDKKLN